MQYPLFKPPIHTGKYLSEVTNSCWYAPGPQNLKLQEALATHFAPSNDFCKPEQFVLTSSATAAFHALVQLLGWETIAISPATWPGMHRAITAAGARHLPPSQATAADVQCEVFTDIGGFQNAEWHHTCQRVKDACHSFYLDFGADFTLLSFYPTKLCPGAEGGAVFCKKPEEAGILQEFINCGVPPLHGSLAHRRLEDCRSDFNFPALKATMPDLLAALNREALEVCGNYTADIEEAHKNLAWAAHELDLHFMPQPIVPYLFQLIFKNNETRSKCAHWLWKDRGLSTAWNFPPSPLLTMPCFPGLTCDDAISILGNVKDFFNEQR